MSDRVRAVLVTKQNRLLAIKRVKPGRAPYWVLPGGGVERGDRSLEDALHREIREELASTADVHSLIQVLRHGSEQHYIYLARIRSWSWADRTGPEFNKAGRGEYILEEIPLAAGALRHIDLVPPETTALLARTIAAGADLFNLPDLRVHAA
jgi:8-oxo-dGTP pyrophosphatase MutT (NUDIX family)